MIGPEFERRLVERVHGAAPPTRPHGSRNFVLRRSSRRTGRTGRWNSAEHLGPGPGGTPWTGSGQGPERRGAPHRPDPDRRWKWPFPPPPRSGSIAEAPGAPGGDGMAPYTRQDGSIVRPSPFPSSGATPPRRPTRRERSNSDGAAGIRRRIFRGGTPGTPGAAAARGPSGPPRYLEGGPGPSLGRWRMGDRGTLPAAPPRSPEAGSNAGAREARSPRRRGSIAPERSLVVPSSGGRGRAIRSESVPPEVRVRAPGFEPEL